ncbi:branched-chain amino acid transporter AzlC [Streptococcus azizii]|uniref:Branched-chain amino acid transporter AzlC n=1 Tax=Streptococcus azizii TaxID=1579424 RepID=A0AB36JLS7_9STRE|nr:MULTISPECIES: AzlC family ABC transporter permease [Streptococcus]MBF0776882.1 AzlC family ABC transporter permease [Streptococcus sp. 19428wD3_AN2]ONK27048.1 branched-chain amino acid transporter AzlC [Streptococcus azizii]ONK28401.1 branched-chain amino acid transporter AzlC [Streptococcus azizii]ONK28481.1 branched-chain amino acid transporter AzlC [Streptococcus azizii]TFU82236.1 branched-chain amino acid ABC transporter permease [Streptococcus sp. AN2]
MRKTMVREGMLDAVPTVLGYASIGLACGIVSVNSGISALEMGLMSLLVYAGSAQFVMCALISAGAPLLSIGVTVFFVNLRHLLLSLHTAALFQGNSLRSNLFIGSFLTDESYGVLLRKHMEAPQVSPCWMYGNNMVSYISWVVFTILGNLIGGLFPNPEQLGLDFALIAMFVGIFVGQLEAMSRHISLKKIVLILLGVFGAYMGLVMLVPAYIGVLIATLIGCLVGVMIDE